MDTDRDAAPGPAAPVPRALADYTGYLLRRAFVRARDCAHVVLPPGSHPGQGAVLASLAFRGPASQQDLSERLRVNRTIMVKLVDRLEAEGLVRRERNPQDRRSYALVVTPAGHEALETLQPMLERGEAMLTTALDASERARLNELLRRLMPDLEDAAPPALLDRTGFLLAHAHYRVRERGDEVLAPLSVEPRHFGALAVLHDIEPAPQRKLAAELDVSGPAVVQLVDDLERAGLVERQRNPEDRRSYALRLTAEGRRRLQQARAAMDAFQADLTAQVGKAGDRELRSLLRKLAGAPPIATPRRERARRR